MRFFSLFLLLLFLLPIVSAIGVSPPTYSINYEEGATESFVFRILNKDSKDTNAYMWTTGAFSEHVTYSEEEFSIKARGYHEVVATITFPPYNTLTDFGKQIVRVHASERAVGEGMFVVTTSVEPWIIVWVPIPGQYAEISKLDVESTVEGFDTSLDVEVTNGGTALLSNKVLSITISSSEGEVLETLVINNIDIEPGESVSFSRDISSKDYPSAKYFATAEIVYDPEMAPSKKETPFFVGSVDVVLAGYTTELQRGKINKAVIKLQSLWGSPLSNVKGEIIVGDSKQTLPTMDFSRFQLINADAYIDVPETDNISLDAMLNLYIPVDKDTIEEKNIPLTFVLIDPIELPEIVEPTVETPKEGKSILLPIFIIGIIVVALLFVLIVVLSKKKPQSKSKGRKK